MTEESVLEGWNIETLDVTAAEEFIFRVASESLVSVIAKFSRVLAVLSSEGEMIERLECFQLLGGCFFFRGF